MMIIMRMSPFIEELRTPTAVLLGDEPLVVRFPRSPRPCDGTLLEMNNPWEVNDPMGIMEIPVIILTG